MTSVHRTQKPRTSDGRVYSPAARLLSTKSSRYLASTAPLPTCELQITGGRLRRSPPPFSPGLSPLLLHLRFLFSAAASVAFSSRFLSLFFSLFLQAASYKRDGRTATKREQVTRHRAMKNRSHRALNRAEIVALIRRFTTHAPVLRITERGTNFKKDAEVGGANNIKGVIRLSYEYIVVHGE